MKIHNFSAGPSILPKEVLEEAAQGVLMYGDTGMSIIEQSHRAKPFESIMEEAESLVRSLMDLDDRYGVIFTSGGASTQFYTVPMNLLNSGDHAAYVDTGVWASKAIKEAKLFGQIDVLASSKDQNYNYIPDIPTIPSNAKYLHLTSNNTIYGTQYHQFPETSVPMVCDMSSDIFSRELNFTAFDLIYAGAQKNMGPAGTTLVVVKKDILGKLNQALPSMIDYRNQIEGNSMYNTPPVFPIYVSMLVMRWIKAQGGLKGMEDRNNAKAKILYDEIDRNSLFTGTARIQDRSKMNVCFVMTNPELENEFMEICKAQGISGIKGHRSVGGFRASIYNAMPIESVQVLVDIMKAFEINKG